MMDKLQIKAAVLSISSPGVHFVDDLKAEQLARRVNEEGTRLRQVHPGRFGLFALTPLPPWPKACEREHGEKDSQFLNSLGHRCGLTIRVPNLVVGQS